jgi:hypothetical protein
MSGWIFPILLRLGPPMKRGKQIDFSTAMGIVLVGPARKFTTDIVRPRK